MLSFKPINATSRHIAGIYKEQECVEIVFFSELKRGERIDNSDYEKKMKDYSNSGDYLDLKDQYQFKLTPSNKVPNLERETIGIFGKSGSGKSYIIKNYVRNYLLLFPTNQVYYVSLNDITKDVSFKDILKNKNLKQINLLSIDSVIDHELYKNCLFVFDDVLDVTPTVDLSKIFTPKEISLMTPGEKMKAENICLKRMKSVKEYIFSSLVNILNLGRKRGISCISVFHKLKNRERSQTVITEASSVILFPYGFGRTSMEEYLIQKMSFNREVADQLLSEKIHMYEFLSINTSGAYFYITPKVIKFFNR